MLLPPLPLLPLPLPAAAASPAARCRCCRCCRCCPAAAAAPAAPAAAAEPGSVLVSCKFKAIQSVLDMVLRDLDPEAHIYIGVKNAPPPEGALFQVVDTIPDWAKKGND